MKKLYLTTAASMMALTLMAQDMVNLDTYAGAQLTTEDLNGTARYVGMGGAMEALGADLSTMTTNPAGIGLFRRGQVAFSFGMVSQVDGKTFQNGSKTNASFDQIGVVFANRLDKQSFINFGFNFHKSRNFNQVLSAANSAKNGSSQNRQTYIKAARGILDNTRYGTSMVDMLYDDSFVDADDAHYYIDADAYRFDRAHTGYIGEYEFNLSGNINDRVYLGITVGLKDVHYNAYTEYSEELAPLAFGDAAGMDYVGLTDDQRITGTGYNVKAGIILRPIEESPFRIGASVSTPTWYKLHAVNYTTLNDVYGLVNDIADDIEFRFNTPWKFGLSLGHTIGTNLALGLSYEYADYTTNDMRSITDYTYSSWDDYYTDNSTSDGEMKRLTERTLNGVSTLKVGAEYKPAANVALRAGYNYVSPMYKTTGERDQTINSPGVYMASTTDYTNWKDTHRLTLGAGFTFDKLRLDVAYQYSMRDGDFYPYMNGLSAEDPATGDILTNQCSAVKVKDNRHQLLCTLSYSF